MITFLKEHIRFSNFWVRTGFILLILSILSNHLVEPENFPFHKDYKFPFFPISISLIAGTIIVLIAKINFNYFEKKHFTRKINTQVLLYFLFSTLGYITILYLALYYILNGIINGTNSYSTYHVISGLAINLLVSAIGIALLFSAEIYDLHKFASVKGTLKVQQGGKTTLINYSDIAFIFSENKIVYITKTDSTKISTDFTLNEVESKLGEQSFFRANRQVILHSHSIEQVQSIENGKLSVVLKPTISAQNPFQINISRYKRQAFKDWFDRKS